MKFGDLRGMLHYVPQFRDRTFVIAIDGGVIDHPGFSNILLDLAALRSLGIHVVLVHGASQQIRDLAARRGAEISNDDGTGTTDGATLELSIDAISRLGSTLMQHLTAVELRAATANALIAHPAGVIKGVDLGHTGRIERVDVGSLRTFIDDGMMPVLPPIAYDGKGNTLRLNSDEAAAEIAVRLGADKIIYLLGDGKCDGRGMPATRQLSMSQTREHCENEPDMCPSLRSKLEHAVMACEEGVKRVHLVYGDPDPSGGDAPLLAELFSNEGVGIMIFADAYHRVRPARRSDVDEMISMMRPAVERDKLLCRSRDEILKRLHDYALIEIDGNVVGCAAAHHYEAEAAVELACVFIKRNHEHQGYGRELVNYAEARARSLGAKRIFALSTQASNYFIEKCGYTIGDPEVLPEERREYYRANSRNSRTLVKE
ncbi:MAG: amino-acid N-acetyltransferase, partial [Verrucomicrobiales bacterium]